jgi:hypothetical protein
MNKNITGGISLEDSEDLFGWEKRIRKQKDKKNS